MVVFTTSLPLNPQAKNTYKEVQLSTAWELHSRFSPTLTFQTDQHDGQQTDQHEPCSHPQI